MEKKNKKFLMYVMPLLFFVSLVLISCETVSKGGMQQSNGNVTSIPTLGSIFKQAEIPAGKAVVYIYRPTSPMFGADVKIPFAVKANDKVLTMLVQGGYYRYVTEPGNIEFGAFDTGFMAPTSISSITVAVKAGQAYYLKGAHGKGMSGRAHLKLVSREVGVNEIANCKAITTP